VDFEPGSVGGVLLASVGMPPLEGEVLSGHVAWLPDRVVSLHRDLSAWDREGRCALGDTLPHRQFWGLLDRLAAVFWQASRAGVKLPIQGPRDVVRALRCVGPAG